MDRARPARPAQLGLGLGLDLPWGSPTGFVHDRATGGHPAPAVARFVRARAGTCSHLFATWQPRDRAVPDPDDYVDAFARFYALAPGAARALHHTALNLGALGAYDRASVVAFTNELVRRCGIDWVNEDLGVWSIAGRTLPVPLPPFLTREGLAASIRNTCMVRRDLAVPLLLEFPGFSEHASRCAGGLHAYDFFRTVVDESGALATLDVGHLLGYQWLRGRRGEALYDELERLPLDATFEIHLSGCAIENDRFIDFHHGVLLDEQLELLSRLLDMCGHVRAVTYEDPRFDDAGRLLPEAIPNVERLAALIEER
jgi:uncharacterized protein (UPF0276 family)